MARDEGERDVASAEADGERAHAARGAGVRVGADDDLPGLGSLTGKLGLREGRRCRRGVPTRTRERLQEEKPHVHDGRVWTPRWR